MCAGLAAPGGLGPKTLAKCRNTTCTTDNFIHHKIVVVTLFYSILKLAQRSQSTL